MSSLPVTSESEPSAYVRFQRRTQQVLSVGADADPLSQAVDVLLILLILGNIAAVVIETVSWIATEWGSLAPPVRDRFGARVHHRYYVERDAQPEAFSSIPAVMWWAVTTLTTVGYGDMCPQTTSGRVLGAMVAVLGIGLFALPAGILGSGFVEQIQARKRGRTKCPHCGQDLD